MLKKMIGLFILLILLVSCTTVPITGRKSMNLIPVSQINSMSFQQYDQFLQQNKLSNNQKQVKMVKKVGLDIQKAVETYYSEKGISDQLKSYNWEFNLVESPEVNAWCMPGGKVVVYTGILPVTKNATGLAVVMGHEIAHALAGHGNERMSQGMLTQLGGIALQKALEQKPEKTQQLWMTSYGLGAQYGAILPYSRMHESEADYLGLIFMAKAGYDPRKAVDFWKRMAKMSAGKEPPEFMSTHPANSTRINKIKEQLPEALKYYQQ